MKLTLLTRQLSPDLGWVEIPTFFRSSLPVDYYGVGYVYMHKK
jgi:hypothetical protein